jgi:hypothetical protein
MGKIISMELSITIFLEAPALHACIGVLEDPAKTDGRFHRFRWKVPSLSF